MTLTVFDPKRWWDHYIVREGPAFQVRKGGGSAAPASGGGDAPHDRKKESVPTMPENIVNIGHPDDDGYPIETLNVEQFVQNPRRLYHKSSVVTVCNALGVPYDPSKGQWVWADPRELHEETIAVLERVGFRMSQRQKLLYHKCETGTVESSFGEGFQFVTPEGVTE